jgi:hypothetical protein
MISMLLKGPDDEIHQFLTWLMDAMTDVDPNMEVEMSDDTVAGMVDRDAMLPTRIQVRTEVN